MKWEHERVILTLLGGETKRWHMHPFMPSQSVADHSWCVAVILSMIDPDCSADDLRSALLHDVAELKHGDLSSPFKRANPEIAESIRKDEAKTLHHWTGHTCGKSPALEIADKLADLWQFAMESARGNRETRAGLARQQQFLNTLPLSKYPNALLIRTAIEEWFLYGSSAFNENATA